MVKRMLIEATHPEETRVVVLDGTRLEEFDVETSTKKQIKGNIYLAKVVRVEPSLQAAFVDYGGNRHGFLAFSEIHPDYYQIPVADRERLLAEVTRQEEEDERRERAAAERRQAQAAASGPQPDTQGEQPQAGDSFGADAVPQEVLQPDHSEHHDDDHHDAHHDDGGAIPLAFIPPAITSSVDITPEDELDQGAEASETIEQEAAASEFSAPSAPAAKPEVPAAPDESNPTTAGETSDAPPPAANNVSEAPQENKSAGVETVGGEEEEEEAAGEKQRRRFVAARHYKIQEVIKRRQIMLIQVVKEERGNKGAALTTYLSLAGRYCVLMPNSPRGGGVSRKITSAQDRRRLKSILGDLELPKNMAVILRTAGAERNKAEIKRDYEYLQRTWNNIREITMSSRAPALIHEEASLIKRAIRDIYSRDIEEVWVEGEEGYKVGKEFMRMLTPSHAKKVQRYKDDLIPLFHRYQVESQMEAINTATVQLRSGGSIVFAQTEALVAIDVNSGRATKERHIEETAYKTNMEAADEIARQLRLRDLAGLVVIDFIDMEDNRNNHAVERRLKEALKADRARIQVGRISHFGLLELSRQRLRPSLIEANFRTCAHCAGSGMVRSTESAAVYSLRMMEEEGVRQRSSEITVTVHPDVALYLLNYKRDSLASIESRYRLKIFVMGDPSLVPPNLRIDRVKADRPRLEDEVPRPQITHASVQEEPEPEDIGIPDDEEAEEPRSEETGEREFRDHHREHRDGGDRNADREGGRKRRRRRRRRGGDRNGEHREGPQQHGGDQPPRENQSWAEPTGESAESQPAEGQSEGQDGGERHGRDRDEHSRRGRRRGRRGGRRRRREHGGEHGGNFQQGASENTGGGEQPQQSWSGEPQSAPAPAPSHEPTPEPQPAASSESGATRFLRALNPWRRSEEPQAGAPEPAPAPPPSSPPAQPVAAEPAGPARKGWWQQPGTKEE